MSDDYSPAKLSQKWTGRTERLLCGVKELWEGSRPKKRLFSFGPPEADDKNDRITPLDAKRALVYRGHVVWGLITRAFFPSYVPGRNTHYGSVVYGLDGHEPDSVFDLAWCVNQLRENDATPPVGTEQIASAIRDDRSNFSRLRLPLDLGAHGESYLSNLCIHRSRLPTGYLHDRFLPLLVAPVETEWCCILPLRFWTPMLKEIWSRGPPAYEPLVFAEMMAHYKIQP